MGLFRNTIEVQNNHVLKSPTSGRNNKICQKRFGLLLSPPFLPIRMVCSENKKWFFCGKNHFLFSDQVWKMWLGHIVKNGPKTHYRLKIALFYLAIRLKIIFCEKNHFLLSRHDKKMPFLADNEFLAHFWQYDPGTFFRLGQKTRSDFFHKRITFYLLSKPF